MSLTSKKFTPFISSIQKMALYETKAVSQKYSFFVKLKLV